MSTETRTREEEGEVSSVDARAMTVLSAQPNIASTIWARFLEPHLSGAEPICVQHDLPIGIDGDELFAKIPEQLIACEWRSNSYRMTLVQSDGFAALIERGTHSNGSMTIRGVTREVADKALAEVGNWFPIVETPVESVSVDFWQSAHGMYTTTRTIEAPKWSEVTHHYPGSIGDELAEMVALELAEPDGRVILWHGPPGTGKTSAIRALARAWQAQARFQVVLDPEPVFSRAASLMEVVLDDGDGDGKWRVLVIEDADDIVRADNERTSQSLSRLLNIGDGIVGQGLKVLVLLTTNEPPARLHPALTRPGRCLSQIAFRKFTPSEARTAFPERDLSGLSKTADLSLAEVLTGRRERDDSTRAPGLYL